MHDEAPGFNAGIASAALAVCILFVHVLLLVPLERLSVRLAEAVGPPIGLTSCFAMIATPLPVILGIVGVCRKGSQGRWGWLGLALTALSLWVGYQAQAANWRQ
jgi:hypothetical protein